MWRTARRLGVSEGDVDDVAQEVSLVVMRREAMIQAGKERAFIVATAARIAANWRRSRRRQGQSLPDFVGFASDDVQDGARDAEQERSLERMRGLALLEASLMEMTEGQRVAFILFELEELSAKEVAEQLDIPEAAVVSRVRRAREVFQRFCQRRRAIDPSGNASGGGDHG